MESTHKYWSGTPRFINRDAKILLPEMISYDENIKKERPHNLSVALESFDQALSLFIFVLQKFHKNRAKWEDAMNTRAAVAMADSTLNYFLLARHSITFGYASETMPLFRACFERMTRCAVFQLEEELAKKFWDGKKISQSQIDKLLSNYFENRVDGTGQVVHRISRNIYEHLSKFSHPNKTMLELRNMKPNDKKEEEGLGIDYSYCSEDQEILRLMSIGMCMAYLIFSLYMFWIVSIKIFGSWASVLHNRIGKLIEENYSLFTHVFLSSKGMFNTKETKS